MDPSNAYFAGLFDGEGCVTIEKKKARGDRGAFAYLLRADVGMTDPRPLLVLKKTFGGSISTYQSSNTRYKRAYGWTLQGVNADRFLRNILPWTLVKTEEIELALEFQETKTERAYFGHPLSPETNALREGYRLALQEMKRQTHAIV